MGKMLISKEEKEKIKKSLNNVLSDLRLLWENVEEDYIQIRLPKSTSLSQYSLFINARKIALEHHSWDESFSYCLERRIFNKVNRTPSDYELALQFVENYEEIRECVSDYVTESNSKKENGFETLKEIDKHYDKEASIEIDFPKSQNVHQIDVYEDEGQTIGVINFGERTIKIITDGDIVLVRRTKEEMNKQKAKRK